MPATIDIAHLVSTKPGVRGGRPCLAGTGITVRQIALLDREGQTPSEIAALIPYTTIAHVHAALAYYFSHKEEIDADIAAEDALYVEGVRLQALHSNDDKR